MPYKDIEKSRMHYRWRYKVDSEYRNRRNMEDLKRKKKQKMKAIHYLGNKCKNCGYSEHPEILVFHHLKDKEFTISNRLKLSWEKLRKELDKCTLLCPNCHALVHINSD